MIEEYVLRLQKTQELSHETTRQLLNYFLLQYMLKNNQVGDMMTRDIPLERLLTVFPKPPETTTRQIMVIPLQKHDFADIDFNRIVMHPKEVHHHHKHATTSYDMWCRYLETFRTIRNTDTASFTES